MARGKCAASASNRRAEQAESRVRQLELQRAEDERQSSARERDLLAQIRKLEASIEQEVVGRTKDRLGANHRAYQERVAALVQDHEDRSQRALKLVCEASEIEVSAHALVEIGAILGVSVHERFLELSSSANRNARRRMTNKQLRNFVTGLDMANRAKDPSMKADIASNRAPQ